MTLSIRDWLTLKPETRQAMAKIFRLNRSSFTHVVNDHVESDGYTAQDLSAITVEAMKELTHLEDNSFDEQFKMMVQMVEGETTNVIKPADVPTEKNAINEPTTTSAGTDTGGKSGSEKKAPTGKK
jgi:hypothetical protein